MPKRNVMEDFKIQIMQLIDLKIEELPAITIGITRILLEKSIAITEIKAVADELIYRLANLSSIEVSDLKDYYCLEIKRYLKTIKC